MATLTDAERGRMIRALQRYQNHHGSRYVWLNRPRTWEYRGPEPVWSKDQIASVFGITVKEADRLVAVWELERGWVSWTAKSISIALMKFVKKHGHWPSTREQRRKNGLPSPYTMRGYGAAAWEEVLNRRGFQSLTPQQVLSIPNLTVRRNAIEKYGLKRVMKAAKFIQQDDFGTLWQLPYRDGGDDSMLYVEVVNKTANPDGTFDHYYLRVPPLMATARQAVAWTFEVADPAFEPQFAFAAES